MIVHSIKDLNNSELVAILKNGLREVDDPNLVKNYHPDYSDSSSNLFFILNKGRFQKGNYFIVTDDDNNYIASAGWNEHTSETALVLTRMYVSKAYRKTFIVGKIILPIIIEQTVAYEKLWMTINDYNKPLYNWFVRNKDTNFSLGWPDIYKQFTPIGKAIVNYTTQYVVEYRRST
jgi:hypothetical protein